jgi:hypothetical protein
METSYTSYSGTKLSPLADLLEEFRRDSDLGVTRCHYDRSPAEGYPRELYMRLLGDIATRKTVEDLGPVVDLDPRHREIITDSPGPEVDSCSRLEDRFGELAKQELLRPRSSRFRRARRGLESLDARVFVDDPSKGGDAMPLIIEKSSHCGWFGQRSALGLRELLINGVRFPAGTVFAVRTNFGADAPHVLGTSAISRIGPARFTNITDPSLAPLDIDRANIDPYLGEKLSIAAQRIVQSVNT